MSRKNAAHLPISSAAPGMNSRRILRPMGVGTGGF